MLLSTRAAMEPIIVLWSGRELLLLPEDSSEGRPIAFLLQSENVDPTLVRAPTEGGRADSLLPEPLLEGLESLPALLLRLLSLLPLSCDAALASLLEVDTGSGDEDEAGACLGGSGGGRDGGGASGGGAADPA